MRIRSLIPLTALAVATGADASSAASRNFGVRNFEKIRVEGPYRVTLKTGVPPFATATGSPAALDRIDLEMRGNVLIVRAMPSTASSTDKDGLGAVDIQVGTHDLYAAELTGAGSLAIDKVKALKFDMTLGGAAYGQIDNAAIDQLSLVLVGNAAGRLSGTAKQMTAVLRGLSTLDSSGLQVSDASIGADGPSTVRALVTKSVKLDGSGTASFSLTGRPSCTLNVKGSVSVSGCK
jgi:hypothetical protein